MFQNPVEIGLIFTGCEFLGFQHCIHPPVREIPTILKFFYIHQRIFASSSCHTNVSSSSYEGSYETPLIQPSRCEVDRNYLLKATISAKILLREWFTIVTSCKKSLRIFMQKVYTKESAEMSTIEAFEGILNHFLNTIVCFDSDSVVYFGSNSVTFNDSNFVVYFDSDSVTFNDSNSVVYFDSNPVILSGLDTNYHNTTSHSNYRPSSHLAIFKDNILIWPQSVMSLMR
ncbi:hypothetical protein QR680_015749 [Steinernema hermaphroditum]|uniref:Uncharacterized protein n=1 Tax=Steinernema hermaphroditum TaxID=289476 RepID=A0AA39H8U5_9BILA|nr:hypothetical protein QR680_015749 [Steinernema hermaphroditum]